MLSLLARVRVPLGFLTAAVAFGFARPSFRSWLVGLAVAAVGEAVRVWAAGHIEKGREITQSGPYRYVRHPLYVGSSLLGAGFVIAAANLAVAVLTATYLAVTLTAAVRTEEAALDEKFDGAYATYRAGSLAPVDRPFSWRRVLANREHRAMAGGILAFGFLYWRVGA